jgi:hypothetical protein
LKRAVGTALGASSTGSGGRIETPSFVGIVMCMFGYLCAFQRYVAGKSTPVAKDVVNYMGENIQPGVKTVATFSWQ